MNPDPGIPVGSWVSGAIGSAGIIALGLTPKGEVNYAPFMLDDGLDDLACVELARRGDEEAARTLFRRLYPLVLKLVRAHLPRRTSEEDLVQIVFTKVFAKLDQFSQKVPLENWVSRGAINTCLNQIKSESARPELRWADLSEEEEEVVRSLAATTEDMPASFAARDLVEKLLGQLEPRERLLLTLLYLEERSVKDIQKTTGWSVPAIKIRAFRARRKLKRHLAQLLGDTKP
jgi:RNA polymerase sigma-70 factor (ECF subfamily)